MTYHIINLHDDRVLCVHRDFDRYYIRSTWDIEDRLTMFETTDLDKAKAALENTKAHWKGSWAIVNARGEVVG